MGAEKQSYGAWLRLYSLQLLLDTVGLAVKGRSGKVTRSSFYCGAWHIMAATATLSIWPERTDARVGL